MSLEASSKEDTWDRAYFSKAGDSPFIFLVIFGVKNSELILSREKHNIDEFPEGLNIQFYSKENEDQKDYIEGFLNGTFGELLKKDNESLYERTTKASSVAVVAGTFPDSDSLRYLKNSIGVIKALTEKSAVSVLDVQTSRLYSIEDWESIFFDSRQPNPHNHIVMLYSEEKDGIWLHTRGMRTFGRPDISLVGWPKEKIEDAQMVANRFIEMFALGMLPEEGKEISVEGLPKSMVTQLGGGHDNFDFNNYYIEIRWPE